MDAKTIKTPDTLPWIPPGKPKDESFNKFVHKKGSIASRINAEVIHQENDLYSFKRNIFLSQVAAKKASLASTVRNLSATILSKVSTSSDSGFRSSFH